MSEITTKEAAVVSSYGVSSLDDSMFMECQLYSRPDHEGYSGSILLKKIGIGDNEDGEEILLPEKNLVFLAKAILAYYEKI